MNNHLKLIIYFHHTYLAISFLTSKIHIVFGQHLDFVLVYLSKNSPSEEKSSLNAQEIQIYL